MKLSKDRNVLKQRMFEMLPYVRVPLGACRFRFFDRLAAGSHLRHWSWWNFSDSPQHFSRIPEKEALRRSAQECEDVKRNGSQRSAVGRPSMKKREIKNAKLEK